MKKLLYLFLLLPISCAPFMAVTGLAAAKVGYDASGDRTTGEVVDDTMIKARIEKEYAQASLAKLFSKVSVQVREGEVLLTGTVEKYEDALKAVELAWTVSNVTDVKNEIGVGKSSFKDRVTGTAKAAQIKAALLVTKGVTSPNYTVEVDENGVAYIFGRAHSEDELNKVLECARTTSGITKVINYAVVKSSK